MAKLNGILDIEGTLGGLSFYKDKETGQTFIKVAKGGHTSASIKKDPHKIKIKECTMEFGAVAKFKSLLLLPVQHVFPYKLSRSVHSSFSSVLHLIMKEDPLHPRGQRLVSEGLKTEKGKQLLLDFLFLPELGVYSLFHGLPKVDLVGGKCSFAGLRLNASAFPAEATHVRVHYFVVDYHTDCNYFVAYSSEKVLLEKADLPAVLPDFKLDSLVDLGVNGSLRVAYVHVQFCKWYEGVLFDLKTKGMLGIRCVGVYSL
jgi:hypothetical protein